MSPYACSPTRVLAIILLLFGYYSDHYKTRGPFIIAGLTMCAVGFAINISAASVGAKYFGTFFVVAGSYAAFPGVVSWCVFVYRSLIYRAFIYRAYSLIGHGTDGY